MRSIVLIFTSIPEDQREMYLGVQEDFDQVAVGHDELGDEVNVEVAVLGVAQLLHELSYK